MSGVMIMAGGTGGHVFPGLAVARCLRAQQIEVTWLGTRRGLEARVVPAADLDIHMEWISIQGVRRTGLINWLLLPIKLSYAVVQAWRILRRQKPQVVLSLGGFVAGPGGIASRLLRTPLVIHEQNAVPGMTNHWLALIANRVLTGFPGAFMEVPAARHVGNPVRSEISALPPPEERLASRRGQLRLLVLGGSQGARVFNEVLPQAMALLSADLRPEIWHQCGQGTKKKLEAAYARASVIANVNPFIEDMAAAYSWADLVLGRAGAMTIAELAAAGCAAILVPYPSAVDDHQTANARFLSERNAAILLPQPECTPDRLAELLREVSENRELLLKMAHAARGCAMIDAAETVAAVCLEVVA